MCSDGLLSCTMLSRRPNSPPFGKPPKALAGLSASGQSDWAWSALLRNTPDADADVIALDWLSDQHGFVLAARRTKVLEGNWSSQLSVDGIEVPTASRWQCTCWFQDDEVSFAELESELTEGVRHVRHVMLSLKEHFAVLNDSGTVENASSEILFQSRMQVSDEFEGVANPITRDLVISDGRVTVRAIPAWLNDDRVYNTSGQFECDSDGLFLEARHHLATRSPSRMKCSVKSAISQCRPVRGSSRLTWPTSDPSRRS